MTTRRLTMMVYGEPGSGKSWLINSAPKPMLLFDSEGRAEYLADLKADPSGMTAQNIVLWDPHNPIPEESSNPDTVTVVNVDDFAVLEMGYNWLQKGDHPWKSVGIDSITELQQRLIDKVAGRSQLQIQDWGVVLRDLERYVRNFRDLRKHPTNPLWAVVVSAGTKGEDRSIPMLQGQLAAKIGHHFDVVGFQHKRVNSQTADRERVLAIDGYHEGYQAKDNTHVLSHHYGEEIIDPNISEMLTVLNPNINKAAAAAESE